MAEKTIYVPSNCPDEYKTKLFLTPADLQELVGIGESLCYSWLQSSECPLRVQKIGGKYVVFANSFWAWYCGSNALAS